MLLAMAPLLLFAYRRELGASENHPVLDGRRGRALTATIAVTLQIGPEFERMDTVTEMEGGYQKRASMAGRLRSKRSRSVPGSEKARTSWTAENAEDIETIER